MARARGRGGHHGINSEAACFFFYGVDGGCGDLRCGSHDYLLVPVSRGHDCTGHWLDFANRELAHEEGEWVRARGNWYDKRFGDFKFEISENGNGESQRRFDFTGGGRRRVLH